MFRKSLVSLVVAASFALAGCGTGTMGTLSTVAIPQAAAPAKASGIVTTVTRGATERQHHQTPAAPLAPVVPQTPAVPLSTLVVNGHIALTDEILAEDAESEGYSVLAKGGDSKLEKKFSKTGVVRRTADGFSLEASNGLLKLFKKKKDAFTLTGAPEIMTQLAARENKKALVKGTVDKDNVVTVLSVKGLANLGFLTNWFTKGKIVGLAVDRETGLPIAGAEVSAKSADGFVFSTASDEDGHFAIKSLTPGEYAVTVVHAGYVTLDAQAVEVAKRKAVDVTAKLAPDAVEPDAPASN